MASRFDINNLPGTEPRPMGLGALASPGLVFKRKFRWTMALQYCIGSGNSADIKTVAEEFVKVGARPQLDIEETEINYLHGKFWLPGKVTFQTMTVTYYDVGGSINSAEFANNPVTACLTSGDVPQIGGVLGFIASVYDITDPCNLNMGSSTGDYQGEALLRLYDGCGFTIEAWLMQNVWPQSVNFGELDMSSSEECTIELTLRYASLQYRSLCPAQSIDRCPCTPCA